MKRQTHMLPMTMSGPHGTTSFLGLGTLNFPTTHNHNNNFQNAHISGNISMGGSSITTTCNTGPEIQKGQSSNFSIPPKVGHKSQKRRRDDNPKQKKIGR